MRILMIAHIGETLGHLVRGLAIARELTKRGIDVEFAASPEAVQLIDGYRLFPLNWEFSHNSCDPITPTSSYKDSILESNKNIEELLKNRRPDLIVGLPGIFTFQIARKLSIPHVSVLHGPYLSPIVTIEGASPAEASVLGFAKDIFINGCVDSIYDYIHKMLGVPAATYEEYLRTENIYIPQPGLSLPGWPNLHPARFIRASIGPIFDEDVKLNEACYVTFGTGNPCDINKIIKRVRAVFPLVVVSTGKTVVPDRIVEGIISRQRIASASLAGKVGAVVSHGGIGTVGTFAEHNTPQLIIPTELDQATMAVHAVRLGIAECCGLEQWASKPMLGRKLPEIADNYLLASLLKLREMKIGPAITSSGAADIAEELQRININKNLFAFSS